MKIMSVDLGDTRTGLAACDKTEFLASPIGVIVEKNFDQCLKKVAIAVKEYQIELIVVGNPINMNGTLGDRSKKSALFKEKLEKIVEIPVVLWDERSTTVSATKYLNEVNVRGKKRKESIDAVAATIILENYMIYRKNQKSKQEEL